MKRVYRYEANTDYWDRRWRQAGEDAPQFEDLTIYPIRYAELVMKTNPGRALEIGCGLGRVIKHYANQGREIVGIERSAVAVERTDQTDPNINIRHGDAFDLPFADGTFDIVLAFGVYHNLENGLRDALAEAARVLRRSGDFVISMRPQNIEMHLNEWYWRCRNRNPGGSELRFHKLLVRDKEFSDILGDVGLKVETVHRAHNMSLLYRLPFLRAANPSTEESVRRSRGYRLNGPGRIINSTLRTLFPYQFSNVLVFQGKRL